LLSGRDQASLGNPQFQIIADSLHKQDIDEQVISAALAEAQLNTVQNARQNLQFTPLGQRLCSLSRQYFVCIPPLGQGLQRKH
jgi:hypothetical protein